MEYEEYLFIPKERVGVLIGEKGAIKRQIEKRTGVKLRINSDGEVDVERPEDADPLLAIKAGEIVKAIGRGFSPEKALKLLSEDVYMRTVELEDVVGKSERAIKRQRARLIGVKGKVRKILEEATGTQLSICGKTVTIIGPLENVELACEAVVMIAEGMRHGDVYRLVERKAKSLDKF
jgi:ribosomal RNA assembly protein